MNSAYTVLWTRDRCRGLKKAGDEGRPLQVLFGGAHQSAPSLKRAGIGHGDIVFPVTVHKGALYVLAGVVVDRFVGIEEYAIDQLGLDPRSVTGLREYQLQERIQKECGLLGHRRPYGCGTEVALAARSTPLRFGLAVAPEHVADITFCPRKGGAMRLKYVDNGKLTHSTSLQGNVRRLCEPSATLFANVVGLAAAAA
jgi:hypothetical protein